MLTTSFPRERDVVKKRIKITDTKIPGKNIYVGETARSLYERTKEHVRDGKKMSEDSHIGRRKMSYDRRRKNREKMEEKTDKRQKERSRKKRKLKKKFWL